MYVARESRLGEANGTILLENRYLELTNIVTNNKEYYFIFIF